MIFLSWGNYSNSGLTWPNITYIYTCSHPQTNCFLVTQLLSVTNFTSLGYLTPNFVILSVSEGIFSYIFIYTLLATGVLNLWKGLCIYTYEAVVNPQLHCTIQWWVAYILSTTDRLLCVTSHAWCLKLGSKPCWLYVNQIS